MKYRKKPLEVEAIYISSVKDIPNEYICSFSMVISGEAINWWNNSVLITAKTPTLIILEADGKGCYPCSPEMFEKLYEKVEE